MALPASVIHREHDRVRGGFSVKHKHKIRDIRGAEGRRAPKSASAPIKGLSVPCAVLMALHAPSVLAKQKELQPNGSGASSSQGMVVPTLKEVTVTALRQSLINAEAIKRDSFGIVDAVTAEDIGKFPDTNLAEAIQRIPGVTIDRQNGEGSRVTVRGFGPQFNLVLLNGREMPGAISGDSASATRSFDFADLSPVGISRIEVYKTSEADLPSGGIGATINIITPKPFDYHGFQATAEVMGNYDAQNREGSNFTPSVAALLSDTFLHRRIGVLFSGSYDKRDNTQEFADVGGWLENPSLGTATVTNNNKNPYGNYWGPQSEDWGFYNHQRTRKNAQLTLQFRPFRSLVATTDYTYSLFEDHQQRHSMGAWFGYGGDLTSATIDNTGTITNLVDAGNDLSYFASNDVFRNEGKSYGVNLKWQASEDWLVTLDGHNSSETSGGGPGGNNSFFIVGQQPNYSISKIFTDTGTQIPLTTWTYMAPYQLNTLGTSTISPLFAQANSTNFKNTIRQAHLDARWTNPNSGFVHNVKFGYEYTDFRTDARSYNSFYPTGFYAPANDGLIPASDFTKISSCSILQSFSGGGCAIQVPYFYTFNVPAAVAATSSTFNYQFVLPNTPTNDDHIEEKTQAAFAQMAFGAHILGRRLKGLIGLRYENTQVVANSLEQIPTAISWDNPTEFHTIYASNSGYSNIRKSYHELLPSIDLTYNLRQNLLVRASYSKTITRPDLTEMVGTTSVSLTPKPGARTAVAGNPGLMPYTSKNYDLSLEWYPTSDDYASVNWFMKRVSNFLTQTTVQEPLFGITDPLNGALAKQAQAQLTAAGQPLTAANVFNQMVADTGQSHFLGQPGDPLVIWDVTTPTNANQTEIHGWEFAVQHIFGNTGFGLQANYSLPMGSARFNNLAIGSQFALPGLSTSYNIVAFYEKHGFQTRLAWTHRSSYLTALSQSQSANEPQYVAAYGQLDMSASYDFNEHWSVMFTGINLNSASERFYGRTPSQFLYAYQGAPRFQFGFRYRD